MTRIWFALILLFAAPLQAEEVVAELSQTRVSITADFTGSDILLFGAVKREDPIPDDSSLEVLVTVEGPKVPITIRRKSKRFGIWINTDAAEIDAAPSFYAIATTSPIKDVLSQTEDLRHHVTIPRAIRAVDTGAVVSELDAFLEALVRIKERADAYQLCKQLLARGLLVKECHHTVIRFAPPLIIEKSQIDDALVIIEQVFNLSST